MPAERGRRLVALSLPPGPDFIAALDEAWAAGDAVLPLDPRAPSATTRAVLTAVRPDHPVDDDVALVIATSGSTGAPKGAQLSTAALEASARATHARIGHEADDRWLACLPWHHIGGIQVLLRSRLLGIPLVVHDHFDVDRVASADASLVSLVPTQLVRLLDAGVDVARFRVILLGAAAAAPALLARAREAGARIVTTYGMSETAGGCVYDGRPLDGVSVRLADDGRIEVRGPVLMSGYRLRPDLDAEVFADGWLRTSDVGAFDDDNDDDGPDDGAGPRLRVIGRVDDIVVTGGENVATPQVAAVLGEHPAVDDVAVTSVADAEWGRRLVAVVVPTAAHGAPSVEELRRWCAGRLPVAAHPREVVVCEAIPRLASGKQDRLAISRLATAGSGDTLYEPLGGAALGSVDVDGADRGREVQQKRQRDTGFEQL